MDEATVAVVQYDKSDCVVDKALFFFSFDREIICSRDCHKRKDLPEKSNYVRA